MNINDLRPTLIAGRKYTVTFAGVFLGTVTSQEEYDRLLATIAPIYTEPEPDDCLIVEDIP